MRLPAGHSLVFQMHYTSMGKATTDRTGIGLKFAQDAAEDRRSTALALINGGLSHPGRRRRHHVDAEMTFNRDITLYSMIPHTHVRGTRVALRSDLSRTAARK